jgi:hypothetical protein
MAEPQAAFTIPVQTEQLKALKRQKTSGYDPVNQSNREYEGPLLSAVLDHALEALPAPDRARFDLIVLHGRGGKRALIPRALVVKFPILLALNHEQAPVSVAPLSSHSRLLKEGVPPGTLYLEGVERVECANSRDRFGALYLKRRTDPSAMRGEKLFVQNCLACHAAGQGPGPEKITAPAEGGGALPARHSAVAGYAELSSRDLRALQSFLTAYHSEKSAQ